MSNPPMASGASDESAAEHATVRHRKKVPVNSMASLDATCGEKENGPSSTTDEPVSKYREKVSWYYVLRFQQ